MVNESKKFEEEDKKKKEEIEVRNTADTAIFTAEKMLKDSADKIEPEDKVKVEEGVAALRKALESDSTDELKSKMDTLTEAVYAVTAKIYQKIQQEQQETASAAGSQGAGSEEKKPEDNVVDADYKMKEE